MGIKGGAGALDRRITFQRLPNANTAAKDSYGEAIGEPVNDPKLCNIPAAYEVAGGRNASGEFPMSEKRHSETTARFRIRWNPHINDQTMMETHRILITENCVTRTYDIKAVTPVGRRVEYHIEVSEVR